MNTIFDYILIKPKKGILSTSKENSFTDEGFDLDYLVYKNREEYFSCNKNRLRFKSRAYAAEFNCILNKKYEISLELDSYEYINVFIRYSGWYNDIEKYELEQICSDLKLNIISTRFHYYLNEFLIDFLKNFSINEL